MTHDIERWSPFKSWLYTLLHRCPKSNTAIVDYAGITEGDRLLDVGCGPGAALEQAARKGADVAGVDPSQSMVDRAAERVPEADVALGSAEQIPFPDAHFTVAINVASFHHWADRDAGLTEIKRVLSPGGRLHIVEGKLKPGRDGHGLSPDDTELLSARLTEIGFENPKVGTIKTGWRHQYFVVSAETPA